METFSPVFVLMAIAVGSFSGGLAIALVYFLRDNLTELTLTRQGLTAQTNNSHVVLEIAGKIERIDSDTKRSIRKATMELELLDMAKYGHAPEIVIVNEVANKPLICAAYENHHTRELKESGVDGYIDEKVSEIRNMVKLWQNDIPDLSNHRINAYVWYWASTVVFPRVKNACNEKLKYYRLLLDRNEIGNSVKTLVRQWIKKNETYIERIDKLADCEAIAQKSTLYKKESSI